MDYVNEATWGASVGHIRSKPKTKTKARTKVKEKVSAAKVKAGGNAKGRASAKGKTSAKGKASAKGKTSVSRSRAKSAKTKNQVRESARLVRARASSGDEFGANAALTKALRGIDVSSYQGKIDWNVVAESNIDFVFIKATEGGSFVDPNYPSNISAAREAKIPCGAYHFFRPKVPVEKQVNNFVKAVGKMQVGDLQPVLDLESASNWDGIAANQRIEMIESWVAGVSSALNCNVTLYMSSSFAQELSVETNELSKYALWVAHYTEEPGPWVPKEWPTWSFWQYTNKGRIEGISVAVDLDLFNGTTEQLGEFRAH